MAADTVQRPTVGLQLRAAFAPATYDASSRSVELTWSTGADVPRSSWDGDFVERLSLAPGAVRLERLNAGAPLLNSHASYDLADVIGVVERAWLAGNQGHAVVRFSYRPEVEPIVQDVKNGILRNISVGYKVHRWETTPPSDSVGVEIRTAIDWEPYELSLVPIPADAGAQVRSEQTNQTENTTMANVIDNDQQTNDLPLDRRERQRCAAILDATRKANLGSEFAEQLINDGTPEADARAAILERMYRRQQQQPQTMHGRFEPQGFGHRADVEQRLVRRLNGEASAISLMQVLEYATGQRGSTEMLVRAAMATTDFPQLLGSAGFQVLREMYGAAPVGARNIARRRQSVNLLDINLLGLSEFPVMMKILEGGEFKAGNLTDRGGSYRIEEYGRIVNLTRRALLQDMLDAFGEAMSSHGRAIAALEDDLVIAALEAGGTGAKCMEDNKALFHADHQNSTTATGLNITSLTEAAAKLREAKEVGNGRRLNLAPRWLLVSAQYEVPAIQLTSEINATAASDVNPFGGGQLALMPLVDANLSGSHAYVLCDPASPAAAIEICTGPAVADVESQNDFETTSVRTRVLADRGLGVRDYRGIVRIPLS